MAKKENGEEKKSKAGGLIGSIIGPTLFIAIIVILIPMLIANIFFAIIDGIISIIKTVIGILWNAITTLFSGEFWRQVNNWLPWTDYSAPPEDSNVYSFEIPNWMIEDLKERMLEGKEEKEGAIDPEAMGFSDLLVKETLVTFYASMYPERSLSIVELTQEELNELLQRHPYIRTEKPGWTKNEIGYISENSFFCFVGDGEVAADGKIYLGCLGKVDINTKSGGQLTFYTEETLDKVAKEYKNEDDEKKKEQIREVLESSYTIGSDGNIVVYEVDSSNHGSYKFTLKNDDNSLEYTEDAFGGGSSSTFKKTLDIFTIADLSNYVLPVELMTDFLTVTGSDEFLEEFIFYAIDRTKVEVRAYVTSETENNYDYNYLYINNDLIFEGYNGFSKSDFDKYKELIYNRIYKGAPFQKNVLKIIKEEIEGLTKEIQQLEGEVKGSETKRKQLEQDIQQLELEIQLLELTNVSGSNDTAITAKNSELTAKKNELNAENTNNAGKSDKINEKKEEKKYWETLNNKLKLAYEPENIGQKNMTAIEASKKTNETSNWDMYIYKGSTWYADITYSKPKVTTKYYIDNVECTKEEYDDFEDTLESRATDVSAPADRITEINIDNNLKTDDINNVKDYYETGILNYVKDGNEARAFFDVAKMRGIRDFSTRDNGEKNSSGTFNYAYYNYKINNIKNAKATTLKKKTLDETAIVVTNYDPSKMYDFLAFLKNEDGKIPKTVGSNLKLDRSFISDGELVKYDDVYRDESIGKVSKGEVGYLLETSVEMFCQLLSFSENTQNLENVYRYIMYIYTGENYGVTLQDLMDLFGKFEFNDVIFGNGGIDLYTPLLTREQFIEALENYTAGNDYVSVFRANAGEIYDTATTYEYPINPELVVVLAQAEGGFKITRGKAYNYWGYGCSNDTNAGVEFSSLTDGIKSLARSIHSYESGSHAAAIMAHYEARKTSGCDSLGYGLPGTLSGWQSRYSGIFVHGDPNNLKHETTDRLNPKTYNGKAAGIYKTVEEYYEKCANVHGVGTPTTPWEQGQYTAWQVREKISTWNSIFGEYASLGEIGGSDIPVADGSVAQKLNFLFPEGIPTSASQMKKYIKPVQVDMTKKDGTKFKGTLQLHEAVHKDVQEVFKAAQDSGFKIYEAGGYNWRTTHKGGISHHSYGIAIDINVNENYMPGVAGSFWNPSSSEFSIPTNGVLVQAFKSRGWGWGGDWKGTKDYMHFSFTGY